MQSSLVYRRTGAREIGPWLKSAEIPMREVQVLPSTAGDGIIGPWEEWGGGFGGVYICSFWSLER